MSVAIIRDSACHRHSCGGGHAERAERLEAIDQMLAEAPFRGELEDVPARDATKDELTWIHTEEHVGRIEASSGRRFTVLDADTAASADSYAAALKAAGASMVAVESVLSGRFTAAFAFVRPPGHHAEADRAMGFCLFNNVAVAAEYARREHGLKRIAVLDWDVHHGNGTMHSFYDSREVLYISLHQYPFYPGTGSVRDVGSGKGEGYTVNVPFPGHQFDEDYLLAFESVLVPVLKAYAPELVIVSAGFDAHIMDPLADMDLSTGCYGKMTRAVMEVAAEASAPIALVLEGGYAVKPLAEGVASVLETLTGVAPGKPGSSASARRPNDAWRPVDHRPASAVTSVLDRLSAALAPYWPSLGSERT